VTDRREKELADLGFAPLVHCKGTDYAAFFSVQSCQKQKMYDREEANAYTRLFTQLPYTLAISRFAHYMKAMMHDKIGSYMTRGDCERFLNGWIQRYVTTDDQPSLSVLEEAERPAVREEVNGRHREAMNHLGRALVAKAENRNDQFRESLRLAYEHERKAADAISQFNIEPTRAVLHRSAATLALQCGQPAAAALLAHRGLAGRPPERIAEELAQLLQQLPPSAKLNESSNPHTAARRPLRSARVSVQDIFGAPGVYRVIAFLEPYFQLEDGSGPLRVAVDLPAAVRC
jgi:predicted component of type VI protein secretion system